MNARSTFWLATAALLPAAVAEAIAIAAAVLTGEENEPSAEGARAMAGQLAS